MRIKLVMVAAGLVAALALAGCSGGGAKKSLSTNSLEKRNGPAAPAPAAVPAQAQAAGTAAASGDAGSAAGGAPGAVPVLAPKIVRNGSISVSVDRGDVQHAFDEASAAATVNGGFVSDSNTAIDADNPTAHLTLRIPSDNLDAVVGSIGRLGKVTAKQFKGQDVSGQLVDLGARIQSLQAEESAYRTLVAQAKAVNDVLAVQNQLFSVRQQIEQLTAQQSSIDNQVTFASLDVQLAELPPAAIHRPEPHPNPVVRAVHLAGQNTAAIAKGVVLAVGWAFPILVLAGLLGLGWLVVRRRLPAAQRPT